MSLSPHSLLRPSSATVLSMLLTLTACPPSAPQCSPATCATGCCSAAGLCVGGADQNACGSNGNECNTCVASQACVDQRCVMKPAAAPMEDTDAGADPGTDAGVVTMPNVCRPFQVLGGSRYSTLAMTLDLASTHLRSYQYQSRGNGFQWILAFFHFQPFTGAFGEYPQSVSFDQGLSGRSSTTLGFDCNADLTSCREYYVPTSGTMTVTSGAANFSKGEFSGVLEDVVFRQSRSNGALVSDGGCYTVDRRQWFDSWDLPNEPDSNVPIELVRDPLLARYDGGVVETGDAGVRWRDGGFNAYEPHAFVYRTDAGFESSLVVWSSEPTTCERAIAGEFYGIRGLVTKGAPFGHFAVNGVNAAVGVVGNGAIDSSELGVGGSFSILPSDDGGMVSGEFSVKVADGREFSGSYHARVCPRQ